MMRRDGEVENLLIVFSATNRDVAVAAAPRSACEVVTGRGVRTDDYRPSDDDVNWVHRAVHEAVVMLTCLAFDVAAI